jgi:hypothetical protein
MTDVMQHLAQATGPLMEILIDLFQHTAERISKLWSALAFAKDCIQDCLIHVKEIRQLCTDAKDQNNVPHMASFGEFGCAKVVSTRKTKQRGPLDLYHSRRFHYYDSFKCIRRCRSMATTDHRPGGDGRFD